MYKKGLAYKLLSFFSLLNLSLQPFFNFLLISAPAFALAQEQIEAGITFDKGKNSFNLTVNKPGEIHYELFYRTDSQIENVSGTSKNDGGNFSQEIYAGTCSSGGVCTPHQVLRGILKIEFENEGWLTSQKFTIDNGKLNFVAESAASDLNLTNEENSWLKNPEQQKIEKECLTDQSLVDTKDEDWQVDKEKGIAETKEKVKLGVKYVFPLENKVSVTFKCLPEDESFKTSLKIQQIKVSDLKLPEGVNPYGEWAYDITTGMQDGTFEYEITLPKPENATAEVSYIEKSVEDATNNEIKTDEVKAVEEEKIAQEGDKVKAEGLDHFTIYIVTKTSPAPNGQACIELGGTSGSSCFNTIQGAIDAASAGDTIKITPGTYTENITISKRLEIVGSGSGDTANDTLITSSSVSTPVVTITASGTSDTQRLVLKDLRVDGNGTGADGIKISSAGSYITFKNVYSVGNDGRGVAADWSGTATGIKILNCSFSNNQGVGFRTGSESSISGIEIKNTHMDRNLNGLYLNAPTTGLTIDGGSFDKNTSGGTNGVGIYALQFNKFNDSDQKPIVLKNFTANENQRGVILHTYGPFSIEDATASKNSEEGITFATSGADYQVSGGSITKPIVIKNVKVEDNPKSNLWVISYLNWTLSNVTIEGSTFGSSTGSSAGYGVYLYAAAGSTLSNVSVKNCTIENNNAGIYLRAGSSTANLTNVALEENSISENKTGILITDNAAGVNHAKFNNIVGNKDFGLVNNDPDTPFDAELNWWNSNLGPTTGTVTGRDKVSGNVNFQEWLCEPYETNWYSEGGKCSTLASCPMNGAIWTTESTCTDVNKNLYSSKEEVYLNGGPHSSGPNGLPNGSYYVRVTNPSGQDILGQSPYPNVTVSNGSIGCLKLWNLVSYTDGTGTQGYKDTTNPGGNYKVWLSPDPNFPNNCSKTDSFKVSSSEVCVEGAGWADIVSSYNPGTLYGEGAITDPIRIDSEKALGSADGSFFSLGKGGEIVLEFTSYVTNVTGNDLSVHETTWDRTNDIEEKAKVYVSQDGYTWMYLGEASSFSDGNNDSKRDGITYFDFDNLESKPIWIKYVRLVESSQGQVSSDDGFDIDAVDEVYGYCEEPKPKPMCGNGKQEAGEQCDGVDGVTTGQNFCSASCQIVPVYSGINSCPVGTVKSQNPLITKTISSKDEDGETFPLPSGGKYLFEASGTYIPTSATGYLSDAGYTTINEVVAPQYGIHGTGNDYTAHALLANLGGGVGVVDWGNYNPNHIYAKYYEPTNSSVQFLISDRYDNWFDTSYNNQSGMNDNSGNLSLEVYECKPASEVTICKEDNKNRPQQGWEVVLASKKVDGPTSINVSDGSGTNSTNLPAGKYLIKISGTYRYGSSSMNADAGFSYRPVSIPSGCDCWLSGFDLASKGLMAWVDGSPVNWGSYNGDHAYTYVYNHSSNGPVNISIWDDYYGDNVNDNNNFQFEIYEIPEGYYGATEEGGCITLENIPYGDYILDEALKDGWINLSGKGSSVSIDSSKESFTLANKLDASVTIVATKIVCDNEADLPDWGIGGPDITATTAQNFLSDHSNCHPEPGWNFQWGDDADVNSSDSYVGEVAGWNTFGPTNSDGLATVNISDYGSTSQIKVREVLKENYIPFTYLTNGSTNKDNVSAEIYCHTDVLNYDNDDRFTPEYGQTYYCVGFNAPKYGSISGAKYEDINGNGQRTDGDNDESEPGLSGWAIQLKDASGGVLKTLITDEKGDYRFDQLIPGTYKVCEVEQPGWKRTQPADSACQAVTVVAGQETTNINFGNTQYGSVEVYKFEDLDGDGKKDGGEPPLPDWEILLGGQTATTSAQGKATFTNLVAGEYNLNENLKDGWQQTGIYCTSDESQTEPTPTPTLTPTPTTPPLVDRILGVNPVFAQIANNNSHQVSVNPGKITTCYIGNFKLGSISGAKIYDKDDDGIQDKGEGGIKGWKIYLSGGSFTEEISTLTDSKGYYEFTGLTAGDYTVSEEERHGWRASKPESGKSGPITISSGIDAKFDFFNAPPVSILLTKSNNATAPVKPGDFVEYTLTITVGERTLSEMTLIDILPNGFSYQTNTSKITTTLGSSTATVNSEPTLKRANKKLVWAWPAGIAGGSVVVVKYTVKIDATNKPSSYTNFAFVWGSGSPTVVESQIVDSVVKIEPAYAPEGKVAGGEVLSAATQTTGQIEGQVLGATLPAAGANTWFLLAAIALIGAGLALKPKKKENRQKN